MFKRSAQEIVPGFYRLLVPLLIFLFTSITFYAQEIKTFNNPRHKIGFMYGYGAQSFLDVYYNYKVVLFQAQYYYAFHRRKKWNLEILAQPQVNFSRYTFSKAGEFYRHSHELGLNLGLLARKKFSGDKFSIYGLISSGPHFVSGVPVNQSSGLIFSNNIFLGASHKIYRRLYLDVRAGFRHMSNAGLKEENGGINNTVLNLGFFYKF